METLLDFATAMGLLNARGRPGDGTGITPSPGGPTTPKDPNKGGQPPRPGPPGTDPNYPGGPVDRPPLQPVDPFPTPGPDGPDPDREPDPIPGPGDPPTLPPPGGPTPTPLPANDNFSKGQVRPDLTPGGPTSQWTGSFDPFLGAGGGSKSGGPSGGDLSPYPRGTPSQWDPLGIGQGNYGGLPPGQYPGGASNVYGMTGVNAATGYQGPARYGVVGGQGGYGVGMVGPEYSGPIFNDPRVALKALRKQERKLNRPIQAQSLGTPTAPPTGGGTDVNQQKGGQPAQPQQPTQQTQGAKGGQPTVAPPVGGVPQTYRDVNGNPISKEAYDAWTSQWRNTLQLPYGHRLYNSPQGAFFESSETAGAPQGVYKQQGSNALHTYQGGQFVPWQQGQAVGTARPGGEVMQQFSLLPRR